MYRLAAAAAFAVAPCAPCAAEVIRFDIVGLNLAIFGVQYTADYLGPHDGLVTKVSAHLEFNSGSFQAQDILLQFEAPVGTTSPFPLWELSGASLGWSGTGTFIANPETPALNGRILDGTLDPGSFSLFFLRIINGAGTLPIGGQFIDSYIEVEYTTIPAPAATFALAGAGLVACRRRRPARA